MTICNSIDELDAMSDQELKALDWKNQLKLNARLLELHGEGELGNEYLAKLPLKPILCIDTIELIDDVEMQASFTFPQDAGDWPYDPAEPLEMLFQDQLDQLVGFWGARKADGIGRALSSGVCRLTKPLFYKPGQTLTFKLSKRKWMQNKNGVGGTAVFNGQILDDEGDVFLDTKNVIVGILNPDDVRALRKTQGGMQGIGAALTDSDEGKLRIPIYDTTPQVTVGSDSGLDVVTATQAIHPKLWPLQYHFRGDPVLPGNFGTHGMIALVKEVAREKFGIQNPAFQSLSRKVFTGMIFEDPKQIRFELKNVTYDKESRQVTAAEGNLYLEKESGERMIDDPIYSFKNIVVAESVAEG